MNKNTYPFEYHIFENTETREFSDDDAENSELKNFLQEKSIKSKIEVSKATLSFSKIEYNKPMMANIVPV